MSNIALSDERNSLAERKLKRVPPVVINAVNAMVDEGLTWQDAAEKVGIQTRQLRRWLEKPLVLAFMRKQREMLRESELASNILYLGRIKRAAPNMPAVNAILALERMGDATSTPGGGLSHSPGITIQINTGPSDERQPVKTTIDLTANPPILDDPA